MFASNVQPRKIIKPKPVAWLCEICDKTIKAFHVRCPSCGLERSE